MTRQRRREITRKLSCERLELRCVLSTIADLALSPASADGDGDLQAVIVAGDPNGSPPDSPANRVDPNLATSPFAGVGSLEINTRRGTYICTATAIDDTHVLTAGHCIDINNDGRSDKKDGIKSISFHLNLDLDNSTDWTAGAVAWTPHPDFTGFNRPSINDDLAVVTLGGSLPTGVPRYPLSAAAMVAEETHLYLVGYGRSGDGVSGYTTNASWTIKRTGENIVDAFYGQDDASKPAADEAFRFDFDGPAGNGPLGGSTLGNELETTLGGGDSGGPSFLLIDPSRPDLAASYELVGVNTFTQGFDAPKFGSLGGGINIVPYRDWILGVSATSPSGGGSGGSGGRRGPASTLDIAVASLVLNPLNGAFLISAAAWPSFAPRGAALPLSAADRMDSVSFAAEIVGEAVLDEPVVIASSRTPPLSADNSQTSDDEADQAVDRLFAEWLTDEEV